MNERIAIFIDGGYLDKVAESENIWIDYRKFAREVAGDQKLLRAYYYNCLPFQSGCPTPNEMEHKAKKDRFYSHLEGLERFEVRLGRLAKRGQGADGKPIFEQKSADILLAIDLIRLSTAHMIDTAVLVAGDSDFIPAIKAAKDAGVSVILRSSRRVYGGLWNICDERIQLTHEFLQRCARPKK